MDIHLQVYALLPGKILKNVISQFREELVTNERTEGLASATNAWV